MHIFQLNSADLNSEMCASNMMANNFAKMHSVLCMLIITVQENRFRALTINIFIIGGELICPQNFHPLHF